MATSAASPSPFRTTFVSPKAASNDRLSAAAAASSTQVKDWRRGLHEAYCAHHESAIIATVPLELRLNALLAEGRRSELRRAEGNETRQRWIKKAYSNLLHDVRGRCRLIRESTDSDTAHKYSIGMEAINCFASMLPWSDSVVAATVVRPSPPMASSASSPPHYAPAPSLQVGGSVITGGFRAFGRRPTPAAAPSITMGGGPTPGTPKFPMDSVGALLGAKPRHQQATVVWRIPERLAADGTKIAAASRSRMARLPRNPMRHTHDTGSQGNAPCGSSAVKA